MIISFSYLQRRHWHSRKQEQQISLKSRIFIFILLYFFVVIYHSRLVRTNISLVHTLIPMCAIWSWGVKVLVNPIFIATRSFHCVTLYVEWQSTCHGLFEFEYFTHKRHITYSKLELKKFNFRLTFRQIASFRWNVLQGWISYGNFKHKKNFKIWENWGITIRNCWKIFYLIMLLHTFLLVTIGILMWVKMLWLPCLNLILFIGIICTTIWNGSCVICIHSKLCQFLFWRR